MRKHFLLSSEIQGSQKVLEQKLNTTISLSGYPFGIFSPITITNLKQNNYAYAFTVVGKPAECPPFDPYQISRYLMTPHMWNHLASLLFSTHSLFSRGEE